MTNRCQNLCGKNQACLSVRGLNLKTDDQESKAACYLCLVIIVQHWVIFGKYSVPQYLWGIGSRGPCGYQTPQMFRFLTYKMVSYN